MARKNQERGHYHRWRSSCREDPEAAILVQLFAEVRRVRYGDPPEQVVRLRAYE